MNTTNFAKGDMKLQGSYTRHMNSKICMDSSKVIEGAFSLISQNDTFFKTNFNDILSSIMQLKKLW